MPASQTSAVPRIINVIYHQPQQAVQALQALQPPLAAGETLNAALFLALAYRQLRQPEAAERAVHPLVTCPLWTVDHEETCGWYVMCKATTA